MKKNNKKRKLEDDEEEEKKVDKVVENMVDSIRYELYSFTDTKKIRAFKNTVMAKVEEQVEEIMVEEEARCVNKKRLHVIYKSYPTLVDIVRRLAVEHCRFHERYPEEYRKHHTMETFSSVIVTYVDNIILRNERRNKLVFLVKERYQNGWLRDEDDEDRVSQLLYGAYTGDLLDTGTATYNLARDRRKSDDWDKYYDL